MHNYKHANARECQELVLLGQSLLQLQPSALTIQPAVPTASKGERWVMAFSKHSPTPTTHQTTRMSLMTLPSEVRLKILRHLLCNDEPIHAHGYFRQTNRTGPWYGRQSERRNFSFYPVVLRLNRQLYEEGIQLLYHHNSMDILVTPSSVSIFDHDFNLESQIGNRAWRAHQKHFDRFSHLDIKIVLTPESQRFDLKTKVAQLVSIIHSYSSPPPPRHIIIRNLDQNLTPKNRTPCPWCPGLHSNLPECHCPSGQLTRSLKHSAALLSSFQRLTNIASVEFCGLVPSETQKWLTPLILSNDHRPPDLLAMYYATANFVRCVRKDSYIDRMAFAYFEYLADQEHGNASKESYNYLIKRELAAPYEINDLPGDDHSPAYPEEHFSQFGSWSLTGMEALKQAADRDDVEAFVALREAILTRTRNVFDSLSRVMPYQKDPDDSFGRGWQVEDESEYEEDEVED